MPTVKKNARCVEKYLFLLRIQISYKKGKSNKHIGIYLNAVHKNHQHIYVHIWEKIYPGRFYSIVSFHKQIIHFFMYRILDFIQKCKSVLFSLSAWREIYNVSNVPLSP